MSIDILKALPKARRGESSQGRLARLEKTVDILTTFLANMEYGEGIRFDKTADGTSIKISSGYDFDSWSGRFPVGDEEGQVLRWNNTDLKWEAGWVTAVGDKPNEQVGRSEEFEETE